MIAPLERLFALHRSHYEPGTLETFRAWFERSGYGDMLQNPYINATHGPRELLGANFKASEFSEISFENSSDEPWSVRFTPDLERNVKSIEDLFGNFVRCIGHTHPLGDYRTYPAHFAERMAGPRFLLFDGAGSCLLLGAMFQALAERVLGDRIDLHYSHASGHHLTHVYATWNDKYFVDPDQKTWALLADVNDRALHGYLFQQLGVCANQLYVGLTDSERASLFTPMTRAYFDFYAPSSFQYMFKKKQSLATLASMFEESRTKFCQPCSVDASDFEWKNHFRDEMNTAGISRPYFLVEAKRAETITIPPSSSLHIGFGNVPLPEEANLLSAIFLGRVPLTLSVQLVSGHAHFELPELPWLLTFERDVSEATINGHKLHPHASHDGSFRVLGAGDLEHVFDLAGSTTPIAIDVVARGSVIRAVLPFNAFTFAANLVDVTAESRADCTISGSRAA